MDDKFPELIKDENGDFGKWRIYIVQTLKDLCKEVETIHEALNALKANDIAALKFDVVQLKISASEAIAQNRKLQDIVFSIKEDLGEVKHTIREVPSLTKSIRDMETYQTTQKATWKILGGMGNFVISVIGASLVFLFKWLVNK